MKKLIKPFYAMAIASTFFMATSCEIAEEPGELTTEVRNFEDFNGIIVETIGDINLYVSNENKIVINTNINVLDDLHTFISDGRLVIQLRGSHRKIQKLEVNVYTTSYNYIRLSGVADIKGFQGFESDRLDIIQDGVGNINLQDLEIQRTYITMNDVGNVYLSGTTENMFCDLDGVGDIKLFDFTAAEGELILTGTGDFEVNVMDFLSIDLSGVGSIFYKGTPQMSINHTGVGKIINVQ